MWRLIDVRKNEKRPRDGDLFEWNPDAIAVKALPVGNRDNLGLSTYEIIPYVCVQESESKKPAQTSSIIF
ncbi:hypothetical protein C9381_09120 [Pantoea vagans]|uniref:Uncharacterized protein n=1 Tax=Pantoea vagans TaxID=470934 RepID=A0AAN1NQF6_9GAMM|nr:hypothetical protein C9381_09120 [Pantoea vagans]